MTGDDKLSGGVAHEVKTAGVGSAVFDEDESELGHIVMLDYDSIRFELVLKDAYAIPGPAVVLSSSPGSWHIWGLRVRSWDEALKQMQQSRASDGFVDEMSDRGRAVLRTQPKLTADNSTRTPPPLPFRVVGDVETEISRPHTIRLRELAAAAQREHVEADLATMLDDETATIGRTLRSETWSYDDSEDEGGERDVRV